MRTRMLLVMAALLAAAIVLSPAVPAHAIQSHIVTTAGACGTFAAAMTLVHTTDDGNNEDRFWLRVFEADTADLVVHIDQSIRRSDSPFFWQVGPIGVPVRSGLYRVELWDVDGNGTPLRAVDQVFYQCWTGAAWRTGQEFPQPADPELPKVSCSTEITVYSTNRASQPGALMAVWSYGHDRAKDDEYHAATWRIQQNEQVYIRNVPVPCGVYIRLYWQPDGTWGRTFLPSQYEPHDDYGTPANKGQDAPWYVTRFP